MRPVAITMRSAVLILMLSAAAVVYSQATSSEDRTFVNQMAIAGMAEVDLGKLASQRGASGDVRMFGQMMVTDHTQANNELMRIAARMNVPPPTQLDQKHRDLMSRLSQLQGVAFDREYMMAMVMGHEEVAAQLRSKTEGDQELTQWATKTLPVVEMHLEHARQIQPQLK